jgi:hypothetical protein
VRERLVSVGVNNAPRQADIWLKPSS